ncbi:MAG: hypothetical protein IJP68_13565 [Selenomonadaceae bacterium]|nr:hypothetical protein [Selenomonadaceae bacterium]
MRILIMAIGFLLAAIQSVSAAVYQQGVVYVIYDETEVDAVKDRTDLNANDVPDVIEDIATQVNAARELFKDVFDFPDPLESERFKEATTIEVDILARENMGNKNGQAISGVRKESKHDPNESAIRIRVANTVNPRKSSTPEHEYFHLIQYGATYFRNGWYLEGMANWSQDSVSAIKEYPDGKNLSSTLKNEATLEDIYQSKYSVSKSLWYPLAVSKKDKAKIPADMIKNYKYVDGSPVFHDDIFYGPNVMREVLRKMKSREEFAAANFGGVEKWRKKGQRNEQNNGFIMECVRDVYNSK